MTGSAPDRSLAQRREALLKANRHRAYRAQLKRDIAAARITAATILADPPPEVLKMRVYDLLLAMPKVGRVKVDQALRRTRTSPSKTVEGLSPRQREELLEMVTPRFRRAA